MEEVTQVTRSYEPVEGPYLLFAICSYWFCGYDSFIVRSLMLINGEHLGDDSDCWGGMLL